MKLRTETTFPHLFSVKVLDKLPGLFKPRRYLYHCARCKWTFVLNDGRRGVLTPVDDGIKPLARDEVAARAATFAPGPCPAMHVVVARTAPELQRIERPRSCAVGGCTPLRATPNQLSR